MIVFNKSWGNVLLANIYQASIMSWALHDTKGFLYILSFSPLQQPYEIHAIILHFIDEKTEGQRN